MTADIVCRRDGGSGKGRLPILHGHGLFGFFIFKETTR
jgi:hypothetical protein